MQLFYSRIIAAAIFVLFSLPALAETKTPPFHPHGMFDSLMGVSVSANKLQYRKSENGDGHAYNLHAVLILPSFSVEHVSSNYTATNFFLGIGFANLIQFQVGNGEMGSLLRVRSDLYFLSYSRKGWDEPFFPVDPKSWSENLFVSFSYSKYHDEKIGGETQIGIGYKFQ